MAPKNTGQKTRYGRTIWQADDGSYYSERTVTAQAPDGKWYNFPSVTADGRILDPNLITTYVESNAFKPFDPITKSNLQSFTDMKSAADSAKNRSEGMIGNALARALQQPALNAFAQAHMGGGF